MNFSSRNTYQPSRGCENFCFLALYLTSHRAACPGTWWCYWQLLHSEIEEENHSRKFLFIYYTKSKPRLAGGWSVKEGLSHHPGFWWSWGQRFLLSQSHLPPPPRQLQSWALEPSGDDLTLSPPSLPTGRKKKGNILVMEMILTLQREKEARVFCQDNAWF